MNLSMLEELNITIEKIQPLLAELAQNLGVAVEHLWEILIKQQYISGFMALAGLIFSIGILILLLKGFKEWKNDVSLVGLMILIGFFTILAFFLTLQATLNNFLNPEYQALVDIFKMLNPR